MEQSDRLDIRWIQEIAKNGHCYNHEAQKMARELIDLRKRFAEYQAALHSHH